MKKYEEFVKLREMSHRGSYNLRCIDIIPHGGLNHDEIYVEAQGVKIICLMYRIT